MFHNFINRYDLYSVIKKGRKSLPILMNKLLSSNKKKVKQRGKKYLTKKIIGGIFQKYWNVGTS